MIMQRLNIGRTATKVHKKNQDLSRCVFVPLAPLCGHKSAVWNAQHLTAGAIIILPHLSQGRLEAGGTRAKQTGPFRTHHFANLVPRPAGSRRYASEADWFIPELIILLLIILPHRSRGRLETGGTRMIMQRLNIGRTATKMHKKHEDLGRCVFVPFVPLCGHKSAVWNAQHLTAGAIIILPYRSQGRLEAGGT
ncbi:hypothetical protein [Pontiella sp.]|uniref:hypothetical protein n=1 Tax=Pontiella sp. TaxID=2837462 RepID=UPI00356AF9CC